MISLVSRQKLDWHVIWYKLDRQNVSRFWVAVLKLEQFRNKLLTNHAPFYLSAYEGQNHSLELSITRLLFHHDPNRVEPLQAISRIEEIKRERANMTRAQQTISIGLLVTSVGSP